MKIDKKNSLHWLLLIAFGLNVFIAMLLRLVLKPSPQPCVLLYGHKLNGNLLVLYQRLSRMPVRVAFLTMDPAYHERLRREGIDSVPAYGPACCRWLAKSVAVISDHGLHAMQIMVRMSDIRFFDVWHGIPFKGFDADDFHFQRDFAEIWVASPLHESLYLERYGFDKSRVCVTGYARTDRLIEGTDDAVALRARFGLPANGKIILFAPTWAQDERNRNIYPFGASEIDFLEALSNLAGRNGATVVMRAHLNSGTAPGRGYDHVVTVPQGEYPDTEGLLLVSDVLVCDWSSIAFDYLLLKRPTIFLDVSPPFRKGFSLGPEYRFGLIAQELGQLLELLQACLQDPQGYWTNVGHRHNDAITAVYGRFADGRSGERCVQRLMHYLPSGESSR